MIKYALIVLCMMFSINSFAYWSCAWPHRTELSVQENTGSTLSHYQVKLTINGSDLDDAYNWTTNGFDLRIIDSDDETLLEFWIEDWDEGSETATVWVKLNSLTGGENRQLYIYYGNQFAGQLANVPFTFIEPGIKFHTRNVSTNPSTFAQAQNLFDAAGDDVSGYGCTFITDFTNVNSRGQFGARSDFIAYSETYFEVKAGETGSWGVRYGGDFGGGGGLYVDGIALEEDWNSDLWWSNNWNNEDVLQGTISLTEGYHKLEVIGQEGCCDGGITVQFEKPGSLFQTYSTNNIDIRSRACPVDEPTITFGAHASASCPAAIAEYRLDEGSWSGTGDVLDQTANFPGTMLGTITEVNNEKICDSAQVSPNENGDTVSAIQTGVDLDADVGAIGSMGFWVKLNNDWNDGLARKIMDASLLPGGLASEKYFFLDKLADGSLQLKFEDSNDGDFTLSEPAGANRVANQWYHIALTFNYPTGEFQIYVNEDVVANQVFTTSGAVKDLNIIQFGDKITSPNLGGTGRSADGAFDEIYIYNSIITLSEIRGAMAVKRSCAAPDLPRECLGSFPDAVSTTNTGVIDFGENAQVLNNPDNSLTAQTVNKNASSTLLTCDSIDCIAANDDIDSVDPGNFQRTNVRNDVTVNTGSSLTNPLGTSTNEFDKLTINTSGTLDFTSENFQEFFIDELITNDKAIVNFTAGTYWIRRLTIDEHIQLNVIGGGPVRLYINDIRRWDTDALINSPAYGVPGNADDLLMYVYQDMDMGVNATISGSVFGKKDITTNQQSHVFGLMTGRNIDIGSESKVTYDVNAYYGLSDISWCDSGAVTVSSIDVSAPAIAVNCTPATIDIQVLDSSDNVIPTYEGALNLSTNTGHGDWSEDASANSNVIQATDDNGLASYDMVAADGGTVRLYLKNTHVESTTITVETAGVNNAVDIDYQASGFIFSNIPTQVSGKASASLNIQAVETDQVTGACQTLLVNNQMVQMAVECISPSNCGVANNQINTTSVPNNVAGSVSNYENVTLDFGNDSSSTASFTNTYSDAGSIRVWARYPLLDANGGVTGNMIEGASNAFVNRPAGFCIEPVDANWQCTIPGLTGNCTAFKQAGNNFDLAVTAKQYSSVSTDYCSHNTTNNFTSSVSLSHNLVAPSAIDGGQAGSFSLSTMNLISGGGTSAVNFDEMGVFTVTAGGNTYMSVTLPTNNSNNIGRFYPANFTIISNTDGVYDNGNSGFTYTGQLESDGTTGSISYLTAPDFSFEVRGFNNQKLNNYLTPFYSTPVVTVEASSATLGNLTTAMTLTAGFSPGTLLGPDVNDQFLYTFNMADHFVFDRNQNSLRAPFNNDTSLTISSFIEPVDSIDITSPYTILGSGGPIYYGRIRIENAYGPETEPVPQLFKTEYFDGSQFVFNQLDNESNYDLLNINTIVVTDVGNASNNLDNNDSTISGDIADSGLFDSGAFLANWSVPSANRYGSFSFIYTVENWLKYDWDSSADGINEDPAGTVHFGQFRGHDRIIYWKEINH